MTDIISFQGAKGAYSDLACRTVFPDMETLPCKTFEDAFAAVTEGRAKLAMIPIDNTLAGRVADVHHLLPKAGLHVIGEFFLPIRHALLAVKGATAKDIKYVMSHIHAIPQCRAAIKRLGLQPIVHADTAGAAEEISKRGDKEYVAIASTLAGQIYGLDVLEENIQDADHNTTRFLILSPDPVLLPYVDGQKVITSLVFRTRHIPAALYKSLGGFATNGVSLAKLESYVGEGFNVARFYCEAEAHPDSRAMQLALEELGFYAEEIRVLGTYPAHEFRWQ